MTGGASMKLLQKMSLILKLKGFKENRALTSPQKIHFYVFGKTIRFRE